MRPARPRRGAQSAPSGPARLLAGAGLAALLGGMVAIVIASGGTGDGPVVSPTATAVAPKPKPTPRRAAAVRITMTGVGAYDPDGDQSENGGDARLATDGNPATAWRSERYRSTFRKTGVGVVVDAGRPVKASRVVVTTATPGYAAEIRIGNSPAGPFVSASGQKTTSPRTAFVLRPRSGRYLMVWITSMPTERAAAVNEIAVTAGG